MPINTPPSWLTALVGRRGCAFPDLSGVRRLLKHKVQCEAIGVAEEKIKRLKSSLEDKEKCHADVVQQLEKTEKDMQAK